MAYPPNFAKFQNDRIADRALAARAAVAKRELQRRRLLPFVEQHRPRYKAGWVHKAICRKLEVFSKAVELEQSPRLLILMPPRHGKSTLASEMFPAWHLGRYPHHELIAASYNISLPTGFSRKVRALLRDPMYEKTFENSKLDPDSQATEAWLTTEGGGYIAAGVGGGITGKGAHVLAIDDPIKNAIEADSLLIRDQLWDWYGSTAYTRLSPGGGVLWIQTWWNEDDGAGRIQLQMAEDPEADQFEIIRFPAIAEEDEYLDADYNLYRPSTDEIPAGALLVRKVGESLHEDRYTLPMLKRIEKTLTKRHWSALYQQNPVPDDGVFFAKDQFLSVVQIPGLDRPKGYCYQAWDFAITEKQKADSTAGVTVVQDSDDCLEVRDMDRFKSEDGFLIVDRMLDAYEKHLPLRIGVEDGQIWRSISAIWKKRCQERQLYPSIELLKPITDKAVRATPLQGRMQHKKVYFNKGAPWYPALEREMLRFQAGGNHDDQVDALAWAAQMCVGRAPPPVPKSKVVKSWKDKLRNLRGLGQPSAMAA